VLPSLDGLRALAVVAVLLYHAEVRRVPGGFLGVESFFVVSGYLITGLLWTEAISTGRLRVLHFWARRARRLLPALAGLVLVTTVGLVVFYSDMVARARGELAAAGAYVSNWYLIVVEQSYFAEAGRPSPFRHLWSLAVEEQFYVLFPLLFGFTLFMVGRRARRIAVISGVAALASALEMWILYVPAKDPSRVYYGTDTRASGLLIGVTLALLWRPWERPDRGRVRTLAALALPSGWPSWITGPLRLVLRFVARTWPDLLATTGLAILLITSLRFAESQDVVYRGGIQLVALATAMVIMGSIVPGSVVGHLLGGRWITAVGRRSYSLYLWHWPVYVATRPGLDLPWSSGPILVVRLVFTVALAELSYRCVERPVRDGEIGRMRRRLRHVLATSAPDRRSRLRRRWSTITAVTAAGLTLVTVAVVQATPPPPLFRVLSSDNLVATGVLPAAPEPAPQAASTTQPPAPPGATTPTTAAAAPVDPAASPPTTPPPAAPAVPTIYAVGDSVMLGSADALVRAMPGIAVNAVVGRQMSEGVDVVRSLAAQGTLPKVLLVHLGNNGDVRSSQFEDLLAAAGPAHIVIVTVKVARRWEGPNNDIIRNFAKDHPAIRMVDWKNIVPGCPGAVFFSDGTHLRGDGQNCLAAHIAPLVLSPWE
jgi:peptidoglycan/LPS O-acetylase OafA/YrhL